MRDSSFKQPMPEYLQNRRAIGYSGDLNPFSYKLFPYKAAGGVWTTPSDIAKFLITLFEDYDGQHNILSSSMMDEVFARDPVRLGFSKIYKESSDDLIFRHYGTNQGFSSYLLGSVRERQALVIMANAHMKTEFLDYIARAAAEYYDWDYLQPIIHLPYAANDTKLSHYVGQYSHNGDKITISLDNQNLTVKLSSSAKVQSLIPIDIGEFIAVETSTKYQFLKPRGMNEGPVKWMRITPPSGSDNYAEKLD
jgi:hypothetical protein